MPVDEQLNVDPSIASSDASRRLEIVGVCAFGAVSWALAFGLRLRGIPAGWWQWRDDAVITLSHARNFVAFGSIGVSPGGDRVEGFSSPLQFLLSSVFFTLTDGGFESFLNLQVTICIVITGSLSALIMYRTATLAELSGTRRVLATTLLTLFTAVFVVSSWTTVGWLVSGMENPLFLVTGFALIALSLGTTSSNWRFAAMGGLIAMLGLTRVELPVLLLPTVGACALVIAAPTRSAVPRPRVSLAWVIGIPAAVWSVVHLSRWVYFGSLLPNTALVQGRATGPRQFFTLAVLTALFGTWTWLTTRPNSKNTRSIQFALTALFFAFLAATGSLRFLIPGSGAVVPLTLFVLLLIAGIGLFAIRKTAGRTSPSDVLVASLVFVPVAQFLVMGPARMEAFRVFSLALPFAVLWLATIVLRLWANSENVSTVTGMTRRRVVVPATCVATAILLGAGFLVDSARTIPWEITSTQAILEVADSLDLNRGVGNALPIVANPDLGKISFQKKAVMVDIGFIGDPLLARVSKMRPDLEVLFLNEVAQPDVVETHDSWSCRFKTWLNSTDFNNNYILHNSGRTGSESKYPDCPEGGRFAIWSRIGSDFEYSLTRKIEGSADPITVIKEAVNECANASGDGMRCQSVRRAVTRNSPMLHEQGFLDDAANAFAASPSFALDHALILRDRGWAERAFVAFSNLADRG